MTDVKVNIDLAGETRPLGLLRRHPARCTETVTFEYDEMWLRDPRRFQWSRRWVAAAGRLRPRVANRYLAQLAIRPSAHGAAS